MTCIPVAICRFFDNNFKRFYLKKKDILWIFYCISEMCMEFGTLWKKKKSILAPLLPKLFYPKEMFT